MRMISQTAQNLKSICFLSCLNVRIDIYIMMADLCFESERIDEGLEYLKKAVGSDKNYAVFIGIIWELI